MARKPRLERVSHPRVDESAIHAERRIPRIEEHAGTADLLGTVGGAGMEISGRKHVEEIFRSDGECIPAPSVGNLQVGQPRGRINLIILYGVVDAAEFTIAALPRGNVPVSLGVALH